MHTIASSADRRSAEHRDPEERKGSTGLNATSTKRRLRAATRGYLTLPLLIGGLATLLHPLRAAQAPPERGDVVFHETFDHGWADRWVVQRLSSRATLFNVVSLVDGEALFAQSDNAASALIRVVDGVEGVAASLSWRWRIEQPLPASTREREKRGDDFVARVFVIFGDELNQDTRALCYVWSASEPVGALFANPHFEQVKTIVVRGGSDRVAEWIIEERDIAADYRRAFGASEAQVGAIALMVDTDNSRSTARSWFDDVRLVVKVSSEQ